jgi:TonB family protein
MLHTKSSSRSYWKLLALLPIVGITLALNAETITEVVYQNDTPQKQVPVKKGKKAGTIKMGSKQVKVVEQDKKDNTVSETVTEVIKAKEVPANNVFQVVDVFDVVEQMPQFPGGIQALMEYLSQNIKYPKEAMEAEKQGRVLVQFIVTKDGSVRAAQVLNHVDEALDAEALRVINAMPNWLPGRQKGEAVNVKYTVPISFRLQGKEKPKAESAATPADSTAKAN